MVKYYQNIVKNLLKGALTYLLYRRFTSILSILNKTSSHIEVVVLKELVVLGSVLLLQTSLNVIENN